jgi:putative Mg2+ transporter-C (MgtC) family protein
MGNTLVEVAAPLAGGRAGTQSRSVWRSETFRYLTRFVPQGKEGSTMELNDPVLMEWLDYDLLSRLGIAAIIGLLLGLDRELRGHAAGMRTHGLICFSAAAMTVSALGLFNTLDAVRADPLRIYEAAGAFIGIIGAGLIVFSKGQVHNLTTAAHLWLAAVIGIACGAAQWPLVAIAFVIGVIMLTLLRLVEPKGRDRKLGKEDEGREG